MRDWKITVVDKVEREQLKHDRFVEEVTHSVEYAVGHKKQVRLYGGIAVGVLLAGFGVWFYLGKQAEARQADLREAILIQDAAVGPGSNPYLKSFPTQAEKETAALKSFSALAAKHGSSEVGAIAKYYQGVIYADQGKYSEAETNFKAAADSGEKDYASLAKYSLAMMYARQNKRDEAEKLLRSLVASPTIFVSKEQAEIELAKLIAPAKPDEAKKLLEPLRSSERSTVSRWAVTAYGEAKLK
ncbi:MAG: tetratricopeptide repeat protein [Acidobacteriota bacterium]|jgi:tetratricopeptide (TPR) repeat protein|nr:tetratricopeptide repeat protein [Acidobacteriaceae bacterium]